MSCIVSGHGARNKSPEHKIVVPKGYKVAYFVNDGELLYDNDAGWPVFNHLLAGDEKWTQNKIVEEVNEGQWTFNYACWDYPEIKRCSGIFKVGAYSTKDPIIDLSNYSFNKYLTLKEIFSQVSPGTIYWVACREVI